MRLSLAYLKYIFSVYYRALRSYYDFRDVYELGGMSVNDISGPPPRDK